MDKPAEHDPVNAERSLARERRIRDTAYEKYLARDGSHSHGDALSDWLAAEAEVDTQGNQDSEAPVPDESIGRNSRITPPRG